MTDLCFNTNSKTHNVTCRRHLSLMSGASRLKSKELGLLLPPHCQRAPKATPHHTVHCSIGPDALVTLSFVFRFLGDYKLSQCPAIFNLRRSYLDLRSLQVVGKRRRSSVRFGWRRTHGGRVVPSGHHLSSSSPDTRPAKGNGKT